MKILKPEDWMDIKLDTSTIQEDVKKYASEIRTRRIGKAKELEATSEKIAQEKQFILNLIEQAKSTLSRLSIDDENKNNLSHLIIKLENAYNQYETSTINLARRFQNAKIRVIAFGTKGQGKSSFIQAFTKLPHEIVTPKEVGSTMDKTGTMCIYFHKPKVSVKDPEIYVVFRKPEDILSKVNEALSMLSKAGLNINGKSHFSSLSEIQHVLEQDKSNHSVYNKIKNLTQDANHVIQDFLSYKNILKDFFYPLSDYSEIINNREKDYFAKDKGKRISLSDLPMYNDMQYEGPRRFSVVSEIHVYVDLGRDNMFENIEICDTKGISVEAGGRAWEEELYSELGNCDAAFSIQFDGDPAAGKETQGFYQKISNEKAVHQDFFNDFALKHYIIINSHTGAILNEVIGNAEAIAQLNIAQSLYIGALINNATVKFKDNNITLSMPKFVDFVIYNMIKSIVVNTNETDKNLMIALEEKKKIVDKTLSDITHEFYIINEELPKEIKGWDDVIEEALFKKIGEVDDCIVKLAKDAKIDIAKTKVHKESHQNINSSQEPKTSSFYNDDEEDDDTEFSGESSYTDNSCVEDISTNEIVPDKNDISKGIYKMLTCEEMKSKVPVDNQEAVRLAVGYLFDKYFRLAGKKGALLKFDILGTAKDIGSFIDHLASLIYDEVNQNVNRYFIAKSDNDNLTDFKDKVFGIIWEGFYINHFCGGQDFSIEFLKQMIKSDEKKSIRLEKWEECYEKYTGDNKATYIYPRTSYAILKAYFDSVTQIPAEEELRSNTHPIFKEEELRNAVIRVYEFHDFASRYIEQINNDNKNKRNVAGALHADIGGKFKYVQELLELYKNLRPHDYGKILGECGLISPSEKAEFENQECIKSFRAIKEQIDSFKSSL